MNLHIKAFSPSLPTASETSLPGERSFNIDGLVSRFTSIGLLSLHLSDKARPPSDIFHFTSTSFRVRQLTRSESHLRSTYIELLAYDNFIQKLPVLRARTRLLHLEFDNFRHDLIARQGMNPSHAISSCLQRAQFHWHYLGFHCLTSEYSSDHSHFDQSTPCNSPESWKACRILHFIIVIADQRSHFSILTTPKYSSLLQHHGGQKRSVYYSGKYFAATQLKAVRV